MPNPIKEALLGRGWAGKTLSRAETAERLNLLIEHQSKLNRKYGYVIRNHGDERVVDVLERLQKTSRVDVAKLSETVLSCGGTPYSGTDLQPSDFDLGDDPLTMLQHLEGLETDFHEALAHELDEVEHQMRTRGVLEAIQSNSTDRLNALEALIRKTEGQPA